MFAFDSRPRARNHELNRHATTPSILLVSFLALVLGPGCAAFNATFFKEKDSLSTVDELLSQIERVHVESEISKERVRASVSALHGIVAPDFSGNAVAAHGEFVNAITQSEKQAEALRMSVKPMKKMAQEVFDRWADDLEAFASGEMRQRSQSRLESTRARYERILAAVEPTQWSFDAFNRGMRDHALFLGHDFNAQAVSEIEDGVSVLTREAEDLDGRFNACLIAAQEYVQTAALPGQHAEPPRAEQ